MAVLKHVKDRGFASTGSWSAIIVGKTEEEVHTAAQKLNDNGSIVLWDFPEEWCDGRPCVTIFGDTSIADTKKEWMEDCKNVLKSICNPE